MKIAAKNNIPEPGRYNVTSQSTKQIFISKSNLANYLDESAYIGQ